jgi:4-carboxymuconolactone decarboxylase
MDTKDLYDRGLKLRKKMFGSAAVVQRMNALGDFGAPLQQIINGYAYGDILSRPGLDARSRSLVMVGMMAASNRPNELRVHLRGALTSGCTPAEIREVLLQVALYCGIPASLEGHNAALEVFEAAGVKIDRKPTKRSRSRSIGPRNGR